MHVESEVGQDGRADDGDSWQGSESVARKYDGSRSRRSLRVIGGGGGGDGADGGGGREASAKDFLHHHGCWLI